MCLKVRVSAGCQKHVVADWNMAIVVQQVHPENQHPCALLSCCRNLFDYDQVINTQRDRVYAERRRALLNDDLSPLMVEYAEKTCDDILEV